MGASTTVLNDSLNSIDATGSPANKAAFVNLNTAADGSTGANESTFTRQACTWNAASAGAKTNSSSLSFSGSSQTCTHFSTWTLVTAGAFGIGGALTSNVTAASITVASGAISLGSSSSSP